MTKIRVPPPAVQSNLRFPKLGFQLRNLQRMQIGSTTATLKRQPADNFRISTYGLVNKPKLQVWEEKN